MLTQGDVDNHKIISSFSITKFSKRQPSAAPENGVRLSILSHKVIIRALKFLD